MALAPLPNCPSCPSIRLDYIPGEIYEREDGIQVRKLFCPGCGYQPPQPWAPHHVKRHQCSSCGHVDEQRIFFRGGSTERPAAAPTSVYVDGNGFAQGLGIQSIPLT